MSTLSIQEAAGQYPYEGHSAEHAYLALVPQLEGDDNGETNYFTTPTLPLPIMSLNTFDAQTRPGHNPRQRELADSIRTVGIMNGLDAATVTPKTLREYADLNERTWGRRTDISRFAPSLHAPGRYDVLVAGHSRRLAILAIEHEKAEARRRVGLDYNLNRVIVPTKIHPVNSPADMLALQIHENTHKAPSQERVAMAMVESYLYGAEQGAWKSFVEFREQNADRFTETQIADAIAFARLPESVRSLVLNQQIRYGAAVELGRFAANVSAYLAFKSFGTTKPADLAEDERHELDLAVHSELMRESAVIMKSKLNVTSAQARYASKRQAMHAEMAANDGSLPEPEQLDLLITHQAVNDLKRRTRENHEETARLIDAMLDGTTSDMLGALSVIRSEIDTDSPIVGTFVKAVERIAEDAHALFL